MIRRNPHAFAGREVADVDEIVDNREEIKRAEKVRSSELDCIPTALPALTLAAKIFTHAGLDVATPAAPPRADATDVEALGEVLLGIVAAAEAVDAEAALRRAALAHADEQLQ
jgi:XTP/dITP diphosphohydrolase